MNRRESGRFERFEADLAKVGMTMDEWLKATNDGSLLDGLDLPLSMLPRAAPAMTQKAILSYMTSSDPPSGLKVYREMHPIPIAE